MGHVMQRCVQRQLVAYRTPLLRYGAEGTV